MNRVSRIYTLEFCASVSEPGKILLELLFSESWRLIKDVQQYEKYLFKKSSWIWARTASFVAFSSSSILHPPAHASLENSPYFWYQRELSGLHTQRIVLIWSVWWLSGRPTEKACLYFAAWIYPSAKIPERNVSKVFVLQSLLLEAIDNRVIKTLGRKGLERRCTYGFGCLQ